ncbi:MAG TPA: hypothetical protein VL947_00780 [Cytophagales bacterium]|nr:hypothetical protein [Cytophagales bacterium]
MKLKAISVVLIMNLISCVAQKHNRYSQDYKKGKDLYEHGAYTEAMPLLLNLTVQNSENKVYKDASLLYALSAIRATKYNEASQMLKQIELKYPEYYSDEVTYHQAVTYFYLREYDKALLTCSKINSSKYKKDIINLKNNFINLYKDTDKLAELYDRNKEDREVAYVLYNKLAAKYPKSSNDKERINTLKAKFGFEEIKSKDFGGNMGVRHVGILLPYYTLGANSLSNTLFYDFHNGLKMGFDSLNKGDERIKLHYFSIEKDTNQLLTFLNSEDFNNLDLIIGPVYNNLGSIALEFNSLNKRTTIINPFSFYIKNANANSKVIFNNPLAETIGSKTAEMCLREFYPKNTVVLYSSNSKDSTSAAFFKSTFEKGRGKVITCKALNKSNIYNINKFITDKNKDSLGAVVVFSNDALVATNVLTAMEVADCKAPIVVPNEWLDINSLTFQKYQRHKAHFIFPNYYSNESPKIRKFNRVYFKHNNLYPTEYAYLGFDLAMYFGERLLLYGDTFNEMLKKEERNSYQGLLQGYNYYNANNNQLVQFVKFEGNKLVPLLDLK